jgi:hypothetical protein
LSVLATQNSASRKISPHAKGRTVRGVAESRVAKESSPQIIGAERHGLADMKTESRVNEAGNYTKPGMRKRLFSRIKAGGKGGRPGQWSARKAQLLATKYKAAGGGYTS